MTDIETILDMFRYCRPAGSKTERRFVQKYLSHFQRDPYKNLVKVIGDRPRILFSSHVDTVHHEGGVQALSYKDGILTSLDRNCLGADDTAGIWLMLEMIKAGIPGVYVIHHAEEKGCIGSTDLAKFNPGFFKDIDIAIAFDRAYYDEVITHQMGLRTASDAFAWSLANQLGQAYRPSPDGAYTDTNEYAHLVPECTNIAVGYSGQHTKSEKQDVPFLIALRDALLQVKWDELVVSRDPAKIEYQDWGWRPPARKRDVMTQIVEDNPAAVAEILRAYGLNERTLFEEIDATWGFVAA
ncbi:M28 family peptidase [Ensifer soli]|uniref:M28 family peptidase n=1 Tax=Ciceribacter sp. sgz301302 TaxID=3342379 RepID=UPI0035B7ECF7